MRFKDKVVAITGASGIMAQTMIEQLLQEGAKIVALDRTLEGINAFKSTLQDAQASNMQIFEVDIASRQKVEDTIKQAIDRYGQIDVLINHAGLSQSESLHTTTPELWESDVAINLNGTYFVTNAILPYMQQAKSGVIVTIGSVNSDQSVGCPAYSAAKAGLIAYMQAIAVEYGRYGIRANTVSPGSVRTKAWDDRVKNNPETFDKVIQWYPLKRLATPKSISNAVLFLASDDADCISGANLRVDAGLSAGMGLFAQDITSQKFV